jgi:hypothetical protein
MKGDYGMSLIKKNPNQRALDDARDAASKVADVNPHDIAIVGEIRKEYTLTQEIAIIRKSLAHMGCDLPEFVEWNNAVESAKAKVNEEHN